MGIARDGPRKSLRDGPRGGEPRTASLALVMRRRLCQPGTRRRRGGWGLGGGRSAGLACGGCSSWASAGAVLGSGVGSARARVSFDEHARSSLAGLAPSRRLCESAARSGSHPSSAGALDRRWRHALASSISLLRGQTPDCFAVMHVAGRVRVPMCYWAVRGR
jgi:hypothetical protein